MKAERILPYARPAGATLLRMRNVDLQRPDRLFRLKTSLENLF
jgi:hypothetical protein